MGKTGYSSQQPSFWNLTENALVKLSTLTVTITMAVAGMTHESRALAVDLPTVKSASLETNLNVPWSQPVKVTDPFEGNYLAVFDKHYFDRWFLNARTKIHVVSLWSAKSVRFLLADNHYGCYSGGYYSYSYKKPTKASLGRQKRALILPTDNSTHGARAVRARVTASSGFYPGFSSPNCVNSSTREAIKLYIQISSQVFQIEGQNSVFAVSDELALALRNSPAGNVDIRLVTRSGETVDSEIGKGTVAAWKAIY